MASKPVLNVFSPRSAEGAAGIAALKASKVPKSCACRVAGGKGGRCSRAATTTMAYTDPVRKVEVRVPCCTQHLKICQPVQEVLRTLPASVSAASSRASTPASAHTDADSASTTASSVDEDMDGLSARMRALKFADAARRARAAAAVLARAKAAAAARVRSGLPAAGWDSDDESLL